MSDLDYEKIQSEIIRPQWLCLHCGKCMPILEENALENFDPNCIRGPISVWDNYPIECGYTGWLFKERENQKHLVRKVKEEIHALSFLPNDTIVSASGMTAQEKIAKLKKQISPWKKHGAEDW